MKITTTIAIILILIALIGMGYAITKTNNLSGMPISGNLALGSNASSTVGLTAKLVLAGASNAQLRTISNVGAFDVWLSATTTNLVANTGLWIKASSSQIFAGDNLYTGNWYAIGTGTTTLSILEI